MLKKIRNISYPAAFVDWMFGTYGREEIMPDNNTIMLMSICYNAGVSYGYNQGCKQAEQIIKIDLFIWSIFLFLDV